MKIKTIIVDDELEAREGIKLLLENEPNVEVLGLCKNGIEAIDMINEHDVDLVYLDIQMPMVNGFEVVNSVAKDRLPYIIFVTAYDQYALKAFEVHAIDYLLKPFTDARFQEGLNRARQLINQKKTLKEKENLKAVADQLAQNESPQDPSLISSEVATRLVVKEKGQVIFISFKDIYWLEAFDYYVKIHVRNKFYLIRESLKKLESKLPVNQFVRIHKSTIINRFCVQEINTGSNSEYFVKLIDETVLKVSRSYRDAIRKMKQ